MNRIRLGISPCPNDTFAFFHLLEKRHDLPFELDLVIADVEELNRGVMAGELDISKVSFHLFGHVVDRYRLLRAGSALGRGCGPLVLTRGQLSLQEVAKGVTALPGRYTTAAMLFRMFMADAGFRDVATVQMNFAHIPDSIAFGRVGAGVVIHETRFTYRQKGLHCLQDLGQWWEETTDMPIPLGGIIASRCLDPGMVNVFDSALAKSIEYARSHPDEALAFCAKYAQEMAPDVMKQHIHLYVNDFTLDIGKEGRAAVDFMLEYGVKYKMFPHPRVKKFIKE
jgi:1,4-dihydroxy-6-naphthoate synthase